MDRFTTSMRASVTRVKAGAWIRGFLGTRGKINLPKFRETGCRVDAPFVAIFTITFFQSLFFHVFILIFGSF